MQARSRSPPCSSVRIGSRLSAPRRNQRRQGKPNPFFQFSGFRKSPEVHIGSQLFRSRCHVVPYFPSTDDLRDDYPNRAELFAFVFTHLGQLGLTLLHLPMAGFTFSFRLGFGFGKGDTATSALNRSNRRLRS